MNFNFVKEYVFKKQYHSTYRPPLQGLSSESACDEAHFHFEQAK